MESLIAATDVVGQQNWAKAEQRSIEAQERGIGGLT